VTSVIGNNRGTYLRIGVKSPAVRISIAIVLLFAASVSAQLKPTRIRVSERVLDGLAIKKTLPSPPCSKDTAHEKGVVTIAMLVDYDGKVKNASPLSGDPVLADCAIPAVQQWQFKPYLINNNPVQVESRVVMKFSKKRVELIVAER